MSVEELLLAVLDSLEDAGGVGWLELDVDEMLSGGRGNLLDELDPPHPAIRRLINKVT